MKEMEIFGKMSITDDKEEIIKKYQTAAKAIIKAGMMPFPLTNTFIEILKYYLDEEDLEFIKAFKMKQSMTMEQLKKKLKDMSEEEIDRIAQKLAKKGFIFNQPSSKGFIVYRLMPIVMIGTFEYQFMQNLPESEAELNRIKKIAELYEKLLEELAGKIQEGYDTIVPVFEKQPSTDRTVTLLSSKGTKSIEINEKMEVQEQVLPAQTIEDIINKFDDIAVGNCFCRQYRKMLGHTCELNAPMETCFTFGKSARHVIQQGFGRRVSKEEALKIMKEAEEAGLIHKAFHNSSNIYKDENSICNCCKDCCDIFNLWRMGATPIITSTNYVSQINQDICIGCGTCIERCPMDTISLNDDNKAVVNESHCIGCGICARFCPEEAVTLKEGMRRVYIPPPRLET
ncbi:MAG: 4Fe-4S binding protein [Candidatus Helarchaeota archaeon]